MISFACDRCGKNLKVKLELAGKKGKCPHCGEPMVAPLASSVVADGKTLLPPATPAVSDGKTLMPRGPGTHGTSPLASGVSPELYDFLAPPQAPDELGRLGGYRILKVLGSGGMGVVYQAEDLTLKRMSAIKAMLPQLAASPSNRERFLREARIAANLEHDHIVAIHRVDEDRGVPFIAMQLLKGQSLEDRLVNDSVVPVSEILRIGRETAAGLQAAHEKGLIHRDIKPANLWLESPSNRVKILDFGLARTAGKESNLTQQGAIIGTPAYMAPEQASGKSVDARSDLFSLGCVLYRLCTGRPPFRGADSIATLMAVATENPKPPHKLNSRIPARLSNLVMRLLSKPVADRPRSAAEVITELQEIEHNPHEAADDDTHHDEELEVVAAPVGKASRADRPRPVAPVIDTAPTGLVPGKVMPWVLAGGGGFVVVVLLIVGLVFLLKPGPIATGPDLAGQPTTPAVTNPSVPSGSGQWLTRATFPANELAPLTAANGGQIPSELDGIIYDPGLTGPVSAAAFNRGGLLATGHAVSNRPGGGGVVKVWDVPTQKEKFHFTGHAGPVHALAFSPDNQWLASGCGDFRFGASSGPGEIRVWELRSGSQVRQLPGHNAPLHTLLFNKSGSLLASTSADRTVKVWDVANAREVASLPGHDGGSTGMVFMGDKILATTGADGQIKIWNVDEQKIIRSWQAHNGSSNALRMARGFMVSCGDDRQVRLWNMDAGNTLYSTFTFHENKVHGVATHLNGLIVSGGADRTVKVYDLTANRFVKSLPAGDEVFGLEISPDGRMAAVPCANGRTYLYRLTPGARPPITVDPTGAAAIQPERTFTGMTVPVTAVAFSADGKSALSGSEDQSVRLWDLEKMERPLQCRLSRRRFGGAVSLVAFQPGDDRWLAANQGGLYGGTCDRMREQPQFEEFPFATTQLAISADLKTVMASCADNKVRLCDLSTGKISNPFSDQNAGRGVALTADGKLAVTSGGGNNGVAVWDLTRSEVDRRLEGHGSPVMALALSQNGKFALSSSTDGTVRLWDVETGSEKRTLTSKESWPPAVAFSPDGKFAAVACSDLVIRLWEVESGKLLYRLEGHTGEVKCLTFSSDGKRLLSGGKDTTMRLWKLP